MKDIVEEEDNKEEFNANLIKVELEEGELSVENKIEHEEGELVKHFCVCDNTAFL